MSKNNVNQTINKIESTEVATPNGTVTVEPTIQAVNRDVYNEYTKELTTLVTTVRTSSLELARLFTEMDERKVLDFATDEQDNGHAVRFQTMSAYAEAVLGINLSDRQLSDYKKVINKFGVKQSDGKYTLDDKYKKFGFSALEIISRKCKTADDFDKVLAMYRLSSNMSDNKMKLAIKEIDDKDKDNSNDTKDNEKKDTSKELKETKKELDEATSKLETVNNVVKGYEVYMKEIRDIATKENYTKLVEYLDKWKLATK